MLADNAVKLSGDNFVMQSARGYVSYSNTNMKYGATYFVHGDRANVATFAGNVETVSSSKHWDEYYYCGDGYKAILPQRFITESGELMQPSR